MAEFLLHSSAPPRVAPGELVNNDSQQYDNDKRRRVNRACLYNNAGLPCVFIVVGAVVTYLYFRLSASEPVKAQKKFQRHPVPTPMPKFQRYPAPTPPYTKDASRFEYRESKVDAMDHANACYIPEDWIELPLLKAADYNYDTKLYDFGLPPGRSLSLPTCGALLVQGNRIVRPYTPISAEDQLGSFQLLVKTYQTGALSTFMANMAVGDTLRFKHLRFNVKIQYPFRQAKRITMITVGTGITPMLQALNKLLFTSGDKTQIVMLNGNKNASDILFRDTLDGYAEKFSARFKLVHTLSRHRPSPGETGKTGETTGPGWQGELGRIDEAMVRKHAFEALPDSLVFVCGVPELYTSVCGPREQAEVPAGSILGKLGYTSDMVHKF